MNCPYNNKDIEVIRKNIPDFVYVIDDYKNYNSGEDKIKEVEVCKDSTDIYDYLIGIKYESTRYVQYDYKTGKKLFDVLVGTDF